MTDKQRIYLMADLWPAACASQGWAPNDRAKRLLALSHALGRKISSANDLNATDDFDRVAAYLKMAADDLAGARETDEPELGDARRLLWKIEAVKAQLRRFITDVDEYANSLCRDIANRGISARVEVVTPEDLSASPIEFRRDGVPRSAPSQLHQLLITLTARLQRLKKQKRSRKRKTE